MSWNFKKELKRKAIHLLSISFIVVYLFFAQMFDEKIALLALSAALIIGIELEYFRIELRLKIPIIHKYFWRFRRKKEAHTMGAEIFFLLGAIVCFAVFDYQIAIAAILMTTFGDLASAIVGSKFGKHWMPWPKDRAWEGVIAELFVNLALGLVLFSLLPILNKEIIITVMAITATIVETAVHKLDDNLLIPVFAGFAGQVTFMLFMFL